MSYNLKPRNGVSKRYQYVSDDDSEMSAVNTSDEEVVELPEKSKVRNELSIRNLLKRGESMKTDEDHIYTKVEKGGRNCIIASKTKSEPPRRVAKRKISSECDDFETSSSKKKKCFSKNAIMARLNRERKKQYVTGLEMENQELQSQNTDYRSRMEKQNKAIGALRQEVSYLKSLLANSKELCQILSALRDSTGLPVSSSVTEQLKQNPKHSPEQGYGSATESSEHSVAAVPYQPRTRSVTSGINFPISDKDINLGSFPANKADDDDLLLPLLGEEIDLNPPFPFEEENNFDFNFDIPNDPFTTNCSDIAFDDPKGSAGLCVHVNGKRISVEFCAQCSSNAMQSWDM